MLADFHLRSFWLTLFAKRLRCRSSRNGTITGRSLGFPAPFLISARDPYLVHGLCTGCESCHGRHIPKPGHFAGRAKYSIFEADSTTWPSNAGTLSEVFRQDGSPELASWRGWSSFDRAVSSESLAFAANAASMGFQL